MKEYSETPKKKGYGSKTIGAISAIAPLFGGIAAAASGDKVGAGERAKRGVATTVGSIAGGATGVVGSMALAQLLARKNPALLKKLVGYRHNQAKTNLRVASSASGTIGSGLGGGLAHKAVKSED